VNGYAVAERTAADNAPSMTVPGVRLLVLLDALVRRDANRPEVSGTLCLGVRRAQGATYWYAQFGEQVRTGFSAEQPIGAEATLLLDEATAESVLRTGRLPADARRASVAGDRAALKKFFGYYTQKTTWLDIRAGKSPR